MYDVMNKGNPPFSFFVHILMLVEGCEVTKNMEAGKPKKKALSAVKFVTWKILCRDILVRS